MPISGQGGKSIRDIDIDQKGRCLKTAARAVAWEKCEPPSSRSLLEYARESGMTDLESLF